MIGICDYLQYIHWDMAARSILLEEHLPLDF